MNLRTRLVRFNILLVSAVFLMGGYAEQSVQGQTQYVQSQTQYEHDTTVYQKADGVIRPSRFEGAKEAYLPIIANSNHCDSLIQLQNGDLLDFTFAGTWEGKNNVSIQMSRLKLGSNRWTVPVIVAHNSGWSDQNPVPFQAPDGRLWLFHSAQMANKGQTTAIIWELTSENNGYTWSPQKELFANPGSFDRQPVVIFHNQWLFPYYHSASFGIIANAQNDYSVVKISKDGGRTWDSCEVPGSKGLVQMNIVKLSSAKLIAFFRSRYADWIYKSYSTDGCHWTVPVPTELPNNNSSMQAVRLKDGHLVMIFNNVQVVTKRGETLAGNRVVLSVALSTDNGETWPWVRDVQAALEPPDYNPAQAPVNSYPSILQTSDGMIQVAWNFRRATSKYMTFNEKWIEQGHESVGVFKGHAKP